ncbi:MAG: hypothetical protein Q9222_005899 [Ikaeria aurantiellina]
MLDAELRAYQHLHALYLDGLIVPRFYGEFVLSSQDLMELRQFLDTLDIEHTSVFHIRERMVNKDDTSVALAGRAILLEYVGWNPLGQEEEITPSLEASLFEGLMTLHNAGVTHGSVKACNVLIVDEPDVVGGRHHRVPIFINLGRAIIQKSIPIGDRHQWPLQIYDEVRKLRVITTTRKNSTESQIHYDTLIPFTAQVSKADICSTTLQNHLVKSLRKMYIPGTPEISWVIENYMYLHKFSASLILEIVRLVAWDRNSGLLADILLRLVPPRAFHLSPAAYWEALGFAMQSKYFSKSIMAKEANECSLAAFDAAIIAYKKEGHNGLDTLRRQGLTHLIYGQYQKASHTWKIVLDQLQQAGRPWHDKVAVQTSLHICHLVQRGLETKAHLDGIQQMIDMATFGDCTTYEHSLPRALSLEDIMVNTSHVWSVSPLGMSMSMAPMAPTYDHYPKGLDTDHITLVKELMKTTHFGKRALNGHAIESSTGQPSSVEPRQAPSSTASPSLPCWLAGIRRLPRVPQINFNDMELNGLAYETRWGIRCMAVHQKQSYEVRVVSDYTNSPGFRMTLTVSLQQLFRQGMQLQHREIQNRTPDGVFVSELFARMQILSKGTKEPLPRIQDCLAWFTFDVRNNAIAGFPIEEELLRSCRPLRGLVLKVLPQCYFLGELLNDKAHRVSRLPSVNVINMMLRKMVVRLHMCGICQLDLSPDNIMLVDGNSGTHCGGIQACQKADIRDLENSSSSELRQEFGLSSFVGTARWCRRGALRDQRSERLLEKHIEERTRG